MPSPSRYGAAITACHSFVPGRSVAESTTSQNMILDLYNATTEALRCQVHMASPALMDQALDASVQAQEEWAKRYTPLDRASILKRAARILESKSHAIAVAETLDTGRPLWETRAEAGGAADCLDWWAGISPTGLGQSMHSDLTKHGSFGFTKRVPWGVTVGIGAWNYPLQSAVWKSAPALAYGNSVVFKPSELTPQTALMLAESYQEAGIPDGVFQVLLGDGPTVGQALINDDRVSKISFTGSVKTGKHIAQQAAASLTPVTLELGGKSPLIIFEDTPLDTAVSAIMMANWLSSGQVCSNGTRVFVEDSIYEAVIDRLMERAKKLRIGDPMDPNTHIGPMISKQHMEKVLKYIDTGKQKDGATLLYGGNRLDDRPGYFMEPAIFVDCQNDMCIAREEIFGMVACMFSFSDEEEVVARANDSSFGLAAGVLTQNLTRAHRVASALQTGTVWINQYNLSPMALPWGGCKESGLGRENGLTAGMEAWTQVQSTYVEMNDLPFDDCPFP